MKSARTLQSKIYTWWTSALSDLSVKQTTSYKISKTMAAQHAPASTTAKTGNVISYDDLKALLEKSSSLLLIDVRSKEEVDKGKIPGSIHIPVDDVEAELKLDPAAFQAKFGVQKPPHDAPDLVFHCLMGGRGGRATQKAQEMGFQNARNYAGGYKEWSEKEGK
ncbi:hypothetical protein GJAV_G00256870 [Gymnothorax javanicus]|nr:hypothetical protein GJAV_G00256870 [Gymnothorax javanicus]